MMRIVYGINPVTEALKSKAPVIKVLISKARADRPVFEIEKLAGSRGIETIRVQQEELERTAGTPRHQGVVAIYAAEFRYREIEDIIDVWKKSGESAFILVLDSIQDPQNFGSLIRAAVAAGVHGIIIPKDRACEVTPAVAKASAGATEHAVIAREVNISRAIEMLKQENVWIAGIEAEGAQTIYKADFDRDLAIVIGSEGKGIRRLVKEHCDFIVSIPMSGRINSLNAAQAGAIAIFEARRQRLSK